MSAQVVCKTQGVDVGECSVVPIAAPSDRNGNPRRCYLIVHSSEGYVAAVDEGHYGPAALDIELGKEIGSLLRGRIAGAIAVQPKTYTDAIKRYGVRGPARQPIYNRGVCNSKLPDGWHEAKDGALVCPHRDLSVCEACARAHAEVVDVGGVHFWVSDPARRAEIAEVAKAVCSGSPLPADHNPPTSV